jgi:hypothetical protein
MPTTEEKFVRILDQHADRLSRIEDANTEEGVPNPLVNARDVTGSTEAVAVDSQATGSMQWGADQWGASEWNPRAP